MTISAHRAELASRMAAGHPFTELEDWIDRLSAPEDVKAALWLLAWSEQERPAQRRLALDALAQVAELH